MNQLLSQKRVLAICETPFQAFGLVAMYNADFFELSKDLVILINRQVLNNCPEALKLIQAITSARIFITKDNYFNSKHLGLESIVWRYSPSSETRKRRGTLHALVGDLDVDILLCASITPLVIDAKNLFCINGETVLYDDGTGTHNGAVAASLALYDEILHNDVVSKLGRSGKAKFFIKHFVNVITRETLLMNVKAVCMFNSKSSGRIYKNLPLYDIPVDDLKAFLYLHRIFPNFACLDNCLDKGIIYLSLPDNATKELINLEESVLRTLTSFQSGHFAIRPHPRTKRFDSLVVHNLIANDVWELMCLFGLISDKTTLIGYASSAQVNPKLIFGLEPRVIFLHRLLNQKQCTEGYSESTYHLLKDLYSHPERVLAPSTLKELKDDILDYDYES